MKTTVKDTSLKVLAFTFMSFMLLACKKDWTCQCEPTEGSIAEVSHIPITGKVKGEASDECRDFSTEELECHLVGYK